MKKKIIANRIPFFFGWYMGLSVILWVFGLLFYVQFNNSFNLLLLIFISIAVVALPIMFYYHVISPMRDLDSDIRRFNKGQNIDGLKGSHYHFTSETKQLTEYLMEISESMQDVKMSNFRSEYRALQNQINPHFLYNTLEAIRSDALVANVKEIADITEALATFFRYTISNLEHQVTIEDELTNVRNYFMIQNYRFGDKIALIVDDQHQPKLMKTLIPKLTLQPIVENAIIHGLERKVGQGQVTIRIHETQNKVVIDVTDDGVGMEDELLDNINNRIHKINQKQMEEKLTKGGIALINVNNRIQMTFGESYGLRVSSVKDFGTTVNITLPKDQNYENRTTEN